MGLRSDTGCPRSHHFRNTDTTELSVNKSLQEREKLAPRVEFEPTTERLTAARSTAELYSFTLAHEYSYCVELF